MGETIKLQDLLNEVNSKNLVLPDFQRKFVWDQDKMKGLFASVLCQMPFGSILTLESADKEFSCKRLGAKSRECGEDVKAGAQIEYLIDGQQRLTTLFAGFSTYYYSSFEKEPKKVAAPRLLDMYFLKIPAENNVNGIDLFNARNLSFDSNYRNEGDNYFSSEDMKSIIDCEKVSKIIKNRKNNIIDLNDKSDFDAVVAYCCSNRDDDHFYRIPLQFILCNKGFARNALKSILIKIAQSFVNTELSDEERNDKCDTWGENVKDYLSKCLSELQLSRIRVKNSDKARAIDIYSNLNQGGVALNVFDLVMAKVGGVTSENFYDTLVGYIKKHYNYPENLTNDHIINREVPSDYHAAKVAEILSDKEEISQLYINNFLTILSFYIANKKGKCFKENGDFNSDLMKQKKILELSAKDIVESVAKVCEAMDRAFFFFHTRCGIRTLADINYKAQFAVVAYFFTNDSYFFNIQVHNFFEYWYWISLFAYMYPSNQNVSIFNEIPKFEKYFSMADKSVITGLSNYETSVLNVPHYSDKETLTMVKAKETEKVPSAVMTDYICQFYLAKGYKDFFEDKFIDFLYSDSLQVHHIMPLGSSPDLSIEDSTKEIRKDKFNKLNSPLNMIYITKEANRKISDMEYSKYSSNPKISNVLSNLGCTTGFSVTIEQFLDSRYAQLRAALTERITKLKATMEK